MIAFPVWVRLNWDAALICTSVTVASCTTWSQKPDGADEGMKAGQTYKHTYRKAGIRWAVAILTEQHQL